MSKSPHAVAVHTSAGSLSYADLADRVARVAHGFMSLGLTGQDRVAFLLPNGVELEISILRRVGLGRLAGSLRPAATTLVRDRIGAGGREQTAVTNVCTCVY